MKQYNKSLFIFRRDLRLEDNTGLNAALQTSTEVFLCFIYDPRQVTQKNNYKSNNAIQFMNESLDDLENAAKKFSCKLNCFYGNTVQVLNNILTKNDINAVFANKDYTPFSIARDKKIAAICIKKKVDFNSYEDILLNAPATVTKKDGNPYTIFTPYWKNAKKISINKPSQLKNRSRLSKTALKIAKKYKTIPAAVLTINNKDLAVHGGRSACKKIVRTIKKFKNYATTRNFPEYDTTHLSAHAKFGTCSIREIYHAIKQQLGSNHPLLRQLYWRDFYTDILYFFPTVLGHAFLEKYDKIPWKFNKKLFKLWCNGSTGFPIIDAGMRELNSTGFMHNRVRMLTASLLIKDLLIDWQRGEKYFAQQLVDYDPAVNNGNWQWVASTGCDHQPYFRIFNPWLQQKKFDPQCIYIKKWIPELRDVPISDIHNWYKKYNNYSIEYPKPIVDHKKQAIIAKSLYKKYK